MQQLNLETMAQSDRSLNIHETRLFSVSTTPPARLLHQKRGGEKKEKKQFQAAGSLLNSNDWERSVKWLKGRRITKNKTKKFEDHHKTFIIFIWTHIHLIKKAVVNKMSLENDLRLIKGHKHFPRNIKWCHRWSHNKRTVQLTVNEEGPL